MLAFGEGRCWLPHRDGERRCLSKMVREEVGCHRCGGQVLVYPVGRKGVCCHTQAVQGGGGCHGEEGVWLVSGNEESFWLRRRRKVLAVRVSEPGRELVREVLLAAGGEGRCWATRWRGELSAAGA